METFTQIPDKWNALDLESRFILAYMLRYQDRGKNYFEKIDTFKEKSGIKPSTFKRRIKALKEAGVIKVVGYIQNAIPIYKVDKAEADWVGQHGLSTRKVKMTQQVDQNDPSDSSNRPNSKVKLNPSIGQNDRHTIQDTRQVTKENTKEEYQPENFSFESFKKNKPTKKQIIDGIDLELFARSLD